jgi:hypothetical protein
MGVYQKYVLFWNIIYGAYMCKSVFMLIFMYGTVPLIINYYGGHPAPAGRALPNLINAVSILKPKSKSKSKSKSKTGDRGRSPLRYGFDVVFDFNVLTALKGWVGLAP